MGLLDGLNLSGGIDPQTALLLGLGSGLLGTVGQGRRATFGEALSAGLMSGTQSMRQAIADRQRAEQLASDERMRARQMQLQDEQLANSREDRRIRELERLRVEDMRRRQEQFGADREAGKFMVSPEAQAVSQFGGPTNTAAAAVPLLRPQVNRDAELTAAMRAGLLGYDKLLELTAKQQPQVDKIDPSKYTPESVSTFVRTGNFSTLVPRDRLENWNGNAVNPYTVKPGAVDMVDPNKAFNLVNGQVVPNLPYQQFALNQAAQGSTKVNVPVNVQTGTTMFKSIADKVGESIAKNFDSAQAARNTINTVTNLRAALDSNQVIAGPAQGARMLFSQAASQLGFGDPQRLQQTALAIQAAAQLELDKAGENKGQGAMTDSERPILRKAAAGDVTSFTVQEMRILAQALDRNARERLRSYGEDMKRLRANPDSGPLADFMAVPEPPPYVPPSQQAMPSGVYNLTPNGGLQPSSGGR